MTAFPARVIAEYERTGNEIIGRALEKAQWSLWDVHGEYWKPGDPLSDASREQYMALCAEIMHLLGPAADWVSIMSGVDDRLLDALVAAWKAVRG